MSGAAFHFFGTPIGRCAIVWRGDAVIGAALPEEDEDRAVASMMRRFPGAEAQLPTGKIAQAVEAVVRLLSGNPEDFSSTPLDLTAVPEFDRKVLELTIAIPPGETRTYGELARSLGSPGAARAVGRALGANPIPIIVPCHRVLAADGKSGGFSAPGGASTKLKILEIEGAIRGSEPELFERLPWRTKPTLRAS